MMRYLYFSFILILSACLPRTIHYPELVAEGELTGKILFKNVSVFTGKDSFLLEKQNVLIDGGIIRQISKDEITNTDGLVISGEGKTLLPGFIDTHVHLVSTSSPPWHPAIPEPSYNLEAFLYAGITTVYDLGGPGEKLEEWKRKVNKGRIPGPDIYHTHSMITVNGSHPIPSMREILPSPAVPIIPLLVTRINEVSDAEKVIKDARRAKADYIKLICDQIPPGSPEMPLELMKALVDEAHRHNLKVFVHIGSKENIIKALDAGVDVLAHGPYKSKLSQSDAERIASQNVAVIYTLSSFNHVNHLCHGDYTPGRLDSLMVPEVLLNSYKGENGKDLNTLPSFRSMGEVIDSASRYYHHNIMLLRKAGVRIIVGTDSPMLGIFPGASIHNEMQQLSETGIPNYLVLQGATKYAAELFQFEPDFGTIEPGKKANLLLLNGNPLIDINATRNIDLVVKNGKVVKRMR
jgi:imidazolonepropionase-like amidohydrolase